MSDMSQGPGWWIASDDKWYPPESHPGAVAARAAAAAEAEAGGAEAGGAEENGSLGTRAASWLPRPRRAPSTPSRFHPPPSVRPLPAPGSPNFGDAPPTATRRSAWPWVLAVVVILGLAVAALVVALTSNSGSGSRLHRLLSGRRLAPPSTSPFPGSGQAGILGHAVGGKDLTGTVVDGVSSVGVLIPGRWRCRPPSSPTREGSAVRRMSSTCPSTRGRPRDNCRTTKFVFYVTGTYGSEPVTASASHIQSDLQQSRTSQKVSFDGHVGSQPITGVVTATMEAGGGVTITGTVNTVPTALTARYLIRLH